MAKKPILTVTHGPLEGKSFVVEDGFVIGRDEACEIGTEDQSTSRKHAQLTVEKEGVRIADLESANGLFVNERKVKSHFLHAGDIVVMGDTTFAFSMPVDPKAARRKFLMMLLIIVLAGGGGMLYVVKQQQDRAARLVQINPDFGQTYKNIEFGFEVDYPTVGDVWRERDFAPRPWASEIFGNFDPVLGNQLTTEKIVLDKYLLVRIWFEINSEWYEFFNFDIEVFDGLAKFHDLTEFSLTDETLPTRRPPNQRFREEQVVRHEDSDLGPYEEGELTFPKGEYDPNGNEVVGYIRSRCYVVGKRRYVLTAETNYKDVERASTVFDKFFDSFKATIDGYPEKTERQLSDAGRQLMQEGKNHSATPKPNSLYKAFLKYGDAARQLKQLPAASTDFRQALAEANRLQESVTRTLKDKRGYVRERLNRVRFIEAAELIEEVYAIVNDNDDNTDLDEKDEWRVWYERAKEESLEIANKVRPGQLAN